MTHYQSQRVSCCKIRNGNVGLYMKQTPGQTLRCVIRAKEHKPDRGHLLSTKIDFKEKLHGGESAAVTPDKSVVKVS